MAIRIAPLFVCLMTVLILAQSTPIDPGNITIVRDQWGVPHIYSKTDAEAAYGLAWAHAEDDFESIQITLLAVKGLLASVKGKDGAILDVLAFLLDTGERVEAEYEESFSPKFKAVLDGYVQGINDYAEKYPGERLHKKAFPVTTRDLIKGYTVAMALMTNVQFDVQRIFGNKVNMQTEREIARGSNAIAVSRRKTTDGKTYLAVNSHQPLEGPFSWYEVHIDTEEGWHFLGATFPGGVTPFHGTNEHLGWAHTLNHPDLSDVYQLTMHPEEKETYLFDGEWLPLEKRKLKLGVKIWWFLKFPFRQTFYRSKYGTTIKNKQGYFALRMPAALEFRAAEQWYWMTKSRNFQEFQDALAMQGSAGINTVYADREDNIYYISNGLLPKRDPSFAWKKTLPGDTSATLWAEEFYPLSELPQLQNPASGYLFNMNNTPFNATATDDNLRPVDFPAAMGYKLHDSARSLRFMKLMENYQQLSYEDFKRIKYDLKYPEPLSTINMANLERILQLDPEQFPEIREVIAALKKWDRSTDVDNRQAAIFTLAIQFLIKHLTDEGIVDQYNTLPDDTYAAALEFAQKHLRKHFKSLEIPLGELQVHVRGKEEFPIWGGYDILAQMYPVKYKKGKYRSYAGESYIQMLRYSRDGVEVETINSYGASNRPESPHYADQIPLYLKQQLKPMTLDKDKIFESAKAIYHPGEKH